ncbi:hypothetical protein IB211_00780c [Intestinimonas butyriciproducens]|uniref:Uncharacterized protein n=1 Tax=Intestinimonas butyriciproducens TaxID=1297617 RepID=A0A0S2W1B1_9FIRM|nr:hypothetical protein IB211_00780c [Intestinimonas butyriciproducens]
MNRLEDNFVLLRKALKIMLQKLGGMFLVFHDSNMDNHVFCPLS